jgi:predicted amidohydrolase YtcJ
MKTALLAAIVAAIPLAAAAQTAAPDLIIHHARVFTADPAHRWAEAVAIGGNRIIAVGTDSEIRSLAGDRTKRVDAGGRVVIPGFNDAHTHQGPLPPAFSLSLDDDPTWDRVLLGVGNAIDETPGDLWVYGTIGPKALADPAATAKSLDKAAGRRVVVLESATGHGLILNSAAMSALHVRDDAADPAGGWFERDASNHLTGKAFEYAGQNILRRLGEMTSESDAVDQLKQYSADALRFGITSIQNMALDPLASYEKLMRHAPPPIRVRMIRFAGTDTTGRDTHEGSGLPATHRERPLAVISGTKWILDGTPVEQGAALRVKYPNTENSGRLNFSADEIKAIVKEGFDSGEQLLLHVVGDRTAATVLDAMRAVAPAEEWRKRRVRFEHGDGLLPDLIPAAKELGIVVVVNPAHDVARGLYPPGAWMPFQSLLKAGIPIAIGSDGPMNPGLNIMLATNRDDALSREQAVDAYTRGSAYAEMMENEKGSIAAGKVADLAVLSQDIFRVKSDELAATASVLTIVDGRVAYDPGVLKGIR